MKRAKSFGVRGLTAEERNDVNPYLGHKVPSGGIGNGISGAVDLDLRNFMLTVYNYMFFGLIITALVAYAAYMLTVTTDPILAAKLDDGSLWQITSTEYLTDLGGMLWGSDISYLVSFGPLVVLLFIAPMFRNLSASGTLVLFLIVAVLVGVSFSGLALVYTNSSMTRVFFCTAAAFGGLSLVGYTSRRDLTGMRTFLWMGFFGLLVSAIANLFLQSDAVQFMVCSVGVIVFAGFTVYDTQMIKEAFSDQLDAEASDKLAISGALDLYLDFINLFRFLIYFGGTEE